MNVALSSRSQFIARKQHSIRSDFLYDHTLSKVGLTFATPIVAEEDAHGQGHLSVQS